MDLTLDLGAIFFVPESIEEWLFIAVPVVIAVRLEQAGQRMSRLSYLFSMVLRIIGLLVLGMFALSGATSIIGVMGEASSNNAWKNLFWITYVYGTVFGFAYGILLTRPIIWRLRDGGLDTRLAYLGAFPIIGTLLAIGLAFWPASKTNRTGGTTTAQTPDSSGPHTFST